MMSQYRIQNQIAVYKTNKKLVEFNDKLKAAPVEYYGHIHAQGEKLNDGSRPRSCIGMILQDYSKGTGENTIRVMANLSPEFFHLRAQPCEDRRRAVRVLGGEDLR